MFACNPRHVVQEEEYHSSMCDTCTLAEIILMNCCKFLTSPENEFKFFTHGESTQQCLSSFPVGDKCVVVLVMFCGGSA